MCLIYVIIKCNCSKSYIGESRKKFVYKVAQNMIIRQHKKLV